MINLIYGGSGSGKTTLAHKIITDLRKSGNTKLLMLVPDQSSFATETAFLDSLGPKLSRDVLVFGFSRLCDYVFSNTGHIQENVIDEGVRNILMSMALDQLQEQLVLFNSRSKKNSVIKLMVHSLKECKKDNITPDLLLKVSSLVKEDTLKAKLKETALVISTYEALISNTYIDPLDNLNKLADILAENDMFRDYTIVVDSFSGFTYQQLEIIRIFMKQCKDFYITFNLDPERVDYEFFATTKRTEKQIKAIAKKESLPIGQKTILSDNLRTDKNDLKFLERNIFSVINNTNEAKTENIELYISNNIYDESDYVANRINRLVYEQEYSFKDIAIVTRDSNKYNGILDVVLKKNNIPYFMDVPQNVFLSPIVRFVCNGIDSVINGFDRELVLSMMKTGLTEFTQEDISDFENYLFVWQINRNSFRNEFKDNPSGFEFMKQSDIESLAKIEGIRKKVIEPLLKFQENTKDATGLEISKAIYQLLQDFNISETINILHSKLESQNLIFEANELLRIYNLLMSTLDKMVAVVGEKKLSLKTYKEYLDFMISDLEIGDIPRYQDQLTIGTADRIRLNDVKAVFVMGAIEGEFPSIPKTAGIFSENERRLLIENSLPLTDSLEDLGCHEKYLAYCALTSAKEKLYVSYHTSDYSGNSYLPSVIFSEILRIFPNATYTSTELMNEFNELWSEQQAFECLAKNYKENNGEVNALKAYFSTKDKFKNILTGIDSYLENKPFAITDKKVAEKLFKKDMFVSASQIEKYNLCAFQCFCNYGLKVKERKVAEIDAMQFGNIVHYFLEQFLKKYNKQTLNQLSADEIQNSIDEIMLEYANDNFGGLEGKSNSFINLFNRLKKNIFTLINEIIRQLQYSDFTPSDFELKIGGDGEIPFYKIDVDDEHSVSVNGYIDRVDIMEKNEDELYVRIVDYKTGNKVFKLSEIMYGVNLQMLIYLRAIVKYGEDYYAKKLIPTGILYMPSFTNEISADKNTSQEAIKKELDKNFKMNGLILDVPEVIDSMDKNGTFIKLGRRAKGAVFSENLANSEQFEKIFQHIDDTIKNMAKSLLSGEVPAKPARGEINGCAYCPYDSICRFESGNDCKFTEKLTADDVYKKLGMEV